MSDVKQVKVDNWGVYFLQRLKHFFNRTDYCDLTLQFQDNAQLKVHRLVLSACTEYFELLERTCEMYEDCLVMPDDLQADVVVPIVNFMYTGQLEFRMDLLERLYQTSQIMNLPVLSKLLESHRQATPKPTHCYTAKRKSSVSSHHTTPSTSQKRSYSKAFETNNTFKEKKAYRASSKEKEEPVYISTPPLAPELKLASKKISLGEPRPTRYELPEELDTDIAFDNSFCNISYTSKPLMVHPETVNRYSSRRSGLFGEPSSSKKYGGTSTLDIVECKKVNSDNIFEDSMPDHCSMDDTDMFGSSFINVKKESTKDASQLFDQILDQHDTPKITIDTKNSKAAAHLDHAKIISEVLKKYSHLLKGSKNIKLKILNTPSKPKKQKSQILSVEEKPVILKTEDDHGMTYETDVLDSKQAAKLIAMGAENIKGPWICLICGAPGKALHFTTYYKFRRHLVEVHNEKPVANICEYCGHKALKRNYLLHHLFSKHGVQPPPQYHFPKCNQCNYIALTEGFLVKHKLTHNSDPAFRCNVCSYTFKSSHQLLHHIQNTGHKYSADRKNNLQCIYCLKVFLRENNLFAHLKTHHKKEAKSDGIIEDSDEESPRMRNEGKMDHVTSVKYEPASNVDNEYEEMDVQYQIRADGNIHVISNKKPKPTPPNSKQKILNPEFGNVKTVQKTKNVQNAQNQHVHNEYLQDINTSTVTNTEGEEIVTIDNNEYIIKDNQFFPRKTKPQVSEEYIISDIIEANAEQNIHTIAPSSSVELRTTHSGNIVDNVQHSSVIINKPTNISQPIRFVVSNEEEYKALMSANHPIIFDSSDNNKTLTVLTTPHTTTLDTATINLNNTQSNEMMIVQEDFPLSVAETVGGDNSNIVVVYSHPVDSQNKQYQFITTQGLEAQFVQSSTIITQNYETVTTSAPIVNAQVINSQAIWPSEVEQTIGNQEVQVDQSDQIQTIVHETETNINTEIHNADNNLSELPDVQLLTEPSKIVVPLISESNETCDKNQDETIIPQDSTNIEEINESIAPEVEQQVTESQTTIIDTPMECNETCEEVVDIGPSTEIKIIEDISVNESVIKKAISMPEVIEEKPDNLDESSPCEVHETSSCEVHETASGEVHETSSCEVHETASGEVHETSSCEVQENISCEINESSLCEVSESSPCEINESSICEEQENQQEEVTDNADAPIQSPTYTQDEDTEADIVPTEQTEIVNSMPQDTETVTPVVLTNEKIKDLTSEWSEDEYDIPEENGEVENKVTDIPQTQSVIITTPVELEESIENIQQEVHKQVSTIVQHRTEPVVNGNTTQGNNTPNTQEPLGNNNETLSQEKISSLLNDWEDNDSQGEPSSEKVETIENHSKIDDTVQISPEENELHDNVIQNALKPEVIKNLVSDWDDDDEEIKTS